MQKARLAVHHRSAYSGVKALRNTSDARRQAAKLCYRFGPLTPSARSANLIAGDGTKNGLPAPNKEPASNQKQPLDRKNPIQVRIHFPPAKSLQTLGPSRNDFEHHADAERFQAEPRDRLAQFAPSGLRETRCGSVGAHAAGCAE